VTGSRPAISRFVVGASAIGSCTKRALRPCHCLSACALCCHAGSLTPRVASRVVAGGARPTTQPQGWTASLAPPLSQCPFIHSHRMGLAPCSFGLSATSQQYFSLRTNQPPTTSQQYFSLRTNQHQPSATSQPNRLWISRTQFEFWRPPPPVIGSSPIRQPPPAGPAAADAEGGPGPAGTCQSRPP
jgi:hypothetical protein